MVASFGNSKGSLFELSPGVAFAGVTKVWQATRVHNLSKYLVSFSLVFSSLVPMPRSASFF